ncbi:hypothetical protein CR513_04355, partial [Mucuna pruriens]
MDDKDIKSTNHEGRIKDGHRGQPDKCEAIIKMKIPQNVKDLYYVASYQEQLRRLDPSSNSSRSQPFFRWNDDWEKAFQDFKQFLALPSVLMRLVDD